MERVIEVRAGWLKGDPLIGHLYIDGVRGEEIQSFAYARNWLEQDNGLTLSPDLSPTPGRQYPARGRQTFCFLSDAAPDRWGRKLIELERQEFYREREKAAPRLTESDYLLRVSDQGRLGGLRFSEHGVFLSQQGEEIPPITQLRELEAAVREYESKRSVVAMRRLLQPGSSLGGARPKANVIDEFGHPWIAKFPSRNDDFSVGKWEAVTNKLAEMCGLRTTQTRVVSLGDTGGIFLSKRFDRGYLDGNVTRRHLASAMTMLDTVDGAGDKDSYLYLAEKAEELASEPERELRELWKRMAFNVCVSNADDHLRNHGFLLNADHSWSLSPVYDINPVCEANHLSLAINDTDKTIDLRLVLDVCDMFRLSREDAVGIASAMQQKIARNWQRLAASHDIAKHEIEWMRTAFRETERNLGRSVVHPGGTTDRPGDCADR